MKVRIEPDIDVSRDDVIATLRRRLEGTPVGALINCAGILARQSLDHFDLEGMRLQFEVNSLGPLRVTHALLPNLHERSKVAMITSRMGSIADNSSGGSYGYRMSKAALNAAGVSLAHDLKPRGIAVGIIHPGWVKTDMTNHQGMITAREAAAGILARIDALGLENTGTFWHQNGEILPW